MQNENDDEYSEGVEYDHDNDPHYLDYIAQIELDPKSYINFQDYLGANALCMCEICEAIVEYDEVDEEGNCFSCSSDEDYEDEDDEEEYEDEDD